MVGSVIKKEEEDEEEEKKFMQIIWAEDCGSK